MRTHWFPVVGALVGGLVACSGAAATPANTPSTVSTTVPTTTAAPPAATVPATAAEPTAAPSPATVRWGPCQDVVDPRADPGECATITVPIDHAQPTGATVDIALYRLPAAGDRIGVLLVNPGGPGASGVDFVRGRPDGFPPGFDVIGFDPRGVGRSSPVECVSPADSDPLFEGARPIDQATLATRLAASERIAAACSATALAGHVGTVDVARDMEAIRVGLGEPTISYLGFSYGGRLGWTYAALYPDRVRAMVLDGPEDPTAGIEQTLVQQAATLEELLDGFEEFCATAGAECPDDPRRAMLDVLAVTERAPLPTRDDATPLAAAYAFNGIFTAMYDDQSYPSLGAALTAALAGDGLPLATLSLWWQDRNGEQPAIATDAQDLIWCSDHTERPTVEEWATIVDHVSAATPTFAGWFPFAVPLCHGYPAAHEPTPPPTSTPAGTVLVVGATGDVATPYVGAQRLAAAMGAPLLTRDGSGHTSVGQSPCIDAYVERFLVDLSPPLDGLVCE